VSITVKGRNHSLLLAGTEERRGGNSVPQKLQGEGKPQGRRKPLKTVKGALNSVINSGGKTRGGGNGEEEGLVKEEKRKREGRNRADAGVRKSKTYLGEQKNKEEGRGRGYNIFLKQARGRAAWYSFFSRDSPEGRTLEKRNWTSG